MEYTILSQDEQDEIIVAYLMAQERDAFCHNLNLERFERMIPSVAEGPWKERITHLRDETKQRLSEVQSLIEATRGQLPPADRINKARARIAAREQSLKQ
jgi:hypothetical protein